MTRIEFKIELRTKNNTMNMTMTTKATVRHQPLKFPVLVGGMRSPSPSIAISSQSRARGAPATR